MSANWQSQVPGEDIKADPIEGGPERMVNSKHEEMEVTRKRIVVVGLGMVGISFM